MNGQSSEEIIWLKNKDGLYEYAGNEVYIELDE